MPIIQRLENIQQTHGELSAVIVREPEESLWCQPPILKTTPAAYTAWEHDRACHVWTESSQFTNTMEDFARLCHSLFDSVMQSRTRVSTGLQEWIQPNISDAVLRWLWFVSGFATVKEPGRTPRAMRKCWGLNGHCFDADRLESLRKNLPAGVAANMPPNAENWMIRLDDVLQVSIDAVESLGGSVERQYSKTLRVATWHDLFVTAKYSENESERSFRNWLKEQISSGNAYRETERGPISFDVEFLQEMNVALPK